MFALAGCQCQDGKLVNSAKSAVDKDKLCALGGAHYDAASNECACDGGRAWDGARCGPPAVGQPAAAEPVLPTEATAAQPASAPAAEESPAVPSAEPMPEPTEPPAKLETPSAGTRKALHAACRRANGHWVEKDGYCYCPRAEVLVGQHCYRLPGRVTDDACLRAVRKGRWNAGVCECAPGLVFSPARGGCVEPYAGHDVTVLRRICESSLNYGKWDQRNARCLCPEGRIIIGEVCMAQSSESSAAVCESPYNRGRWSPAAKACACPRGRLWIDQTCRPLDLIEPRTACQSELSRGTWNVSMGTCICPGLTHWWPAEKRCR
jgi:hypothetical protein